jgi:hypothetical protein
MQTHTHIHTHTPLKAGRMDALAEMQSGVNHTHTHS